MKHLFLHFVIAASVIAVILGTVSIYFRLTRQNESIQHGVRNTDENITYLFLVGTEGTGHHLYNELYEHCPSNHSLQVHGMKDRLVALHQTLYNHKEKSSGLFSMLVSRRQLRIQAAYSQFRKTIWSFHRNATNTRQQYPEDFATPTVVALNALNFVGSGMLSYPNYHGNPGRVLQIAHLELIYKACDELGLRCRHLVIYREPYSIIKSTTVNRKFSKPLKQILIMSNMAKVIRSQISAFPDRLGMCWDYDDPDNEKQLRELGQWLGYRGRNVTGFVRHYRKVFHRRPALTATEKREILSGVFTSEDNSMTNRTIQRFMDAFERDNELLWKTCQQQYETLVQRRKEIDGAEYLSLPEISRTQEN